MMKKILVILMAFFLVLPLAACTTKSQPKKVQKVDQSAALIQKNRKKWNKQVADLPVEHAKGIGMNDAKIPTSMDDLKKASPMVIQGTIINYQQMKNPHNIAYTKATILVDKVIKGDKSLENKQIISTFDGGVTTSNSYFMNLNQTREANHDIFVEFQEFPMPKIGAKIISGIYSLIPVVGAKDSKTDEVLPTDNRTQAMKNSKFDFAKTYDLNNSQNGLWVKNPKDTKYHLNNPKELKRLEKTPDQKQAIEKLTDELNQKYNK